MPRIKDSPFVTSSRLGHRRTRTDSRPTLSASCRDEEASVTGRSSLVARRENPRRSPTITISTRHYAAARTAYLKPNPTEEGSKRQRDIPRDRTALPSELVSSCLSEAKRNGRRVEEEGVMLVEVPSTAQQTGQI